MKLFDGMPDPEGEDLSDWSIGYENERDNIDLWHMEQCREYNQAVYEPPAYECMCEKVAFALCEILSINMMRFMYGRFPGDLPM